MSLLSIERGVYAALGCTDANKYQSASRQITGFVLAALEDDGYAVVPIRASAKAVAQVLPQVEAPDDMDVAIGSAACAILPQAPLRHEPHSIASELARDYRKLVAVLRTTEEQTQDETLSKWSVPL